MNYTVDPSVLNEVLSAKLVDAVKEAAMWQSVASSQGEEITGLKSHVASLEEKLAGQADEPEPEPSPKKSK